MIAGDARLDAVQRLDIYANMYFFRLLDILRGDYGAVVAAVGDDDVSQPGDRLSPGLSVDAPVGAQRRRAAAARSWRRTRSRRSGRGSASWRGSSARASSCSTGPTPSRSTLDELRARAPDEFATLPLPLVPIAPFVDVEHAVDDVARAR